MLHPHLMTPGLNRKYSTTMKRGLLVKNAVAYWPTALEEKKFYIGLIFFFSLQPLFVKPKPLDFANMFSAI
jgi:hypothetical protein